MVELLRNGQKKAKVIEAPNKEVVYRNLILIPRPDVDKIPLTINVSIWEKEIWCVTDFHF